MTTLLKGLSIIGQQIWVSPTFQKFTLSHLTFMKDRKEIRRFLSRGEKRQRRSTFVL